MSLHSRGKKKSINQSIDQSILPIKHYHKYLLPTVHIYPSSPSPPCPHPLSSTSPSPLPHRHNLQRVPKNPLQVLPLLQPHTKPHQTHLTAKPFRPLQLAIMRQQNKRTRQRKIRAQTRSLVCIQMIEKHSRVLHGMEGCGE